MNKDTIELFRRKGSILGYNLMPSSDPINEKFLLDSLIEWAQKPENLNKKVYRHLHRRANENISETDFYYYQDCYGHKFSDEECEKLYQKGKTTAFFEPGKYQIIRHPRCEEVDYLDIYWQEK